MTLLKTKTVAALSIGVYLLTGAGVSNIAFGHAADHHMPDHPAPGHHTPELPKAQQIKVTIDGGFHPGKTEVHAGQEVRLTLERTEAHGCGDVVKFPELFETVDGKEVAIERALKPGEHTTIAFTPKEKGTLHFACGMGMYQGSIIVK